MKEGVMTDEVRWVYGKGVWNSESKSPAHQFDCEYLQLSNSKGRSTNVVMRYKKEDVEYFNYVVTDVGNISGVEEAKESEGNDIRAQWRDDMILNIGMCGRNAIVCLMSARFVEYNKILGLRQRTNVLWPTDLYFVKFTSDKVSKETLIAAGITSRIVNDLVKRGIAKLSH